MSEEQRADRRFRTALAGRFAGASVTTANLSMGGAQLVCPSMAFEHARRDVEAGTPRLELELGTEGRLVSDTRVAYVSEAGDEFLIGVAFTAIEGDGGARLERHLLRTAGPGYVRGRPTG